MAKNRLIDLNDHLFMQLERLNDDDLDTAALEKEGKRTAFLTDVADKLIRNADLLLRARIAADSTIRGDKILPKILGADYGPDADSPIPIENPKPFKQ